jgi:hypothetical protein
MYVSASDISGTPYSVRSTGGHVLVDCPYVYGVNATSTGTYSTVFTGKVSDVLKSGTGTFKASIIEGGVNQSDGLIEAIYEGTQSAPPNIYTFSGGKCKLIVRDLTGISAFQQTGGESDLTLEGSGNLSTYAFENYVTGGVCTVNGYLKVTNSVPYVFRVDGTGTLQLDGKIELTQLVGTGGLNNYGIRVNGTGKLITRNATIISADTTFIPIETTSGTPLAKLNGINTNAAVALANPLTGFTGYTFNLNQSATVE